MSFYHLSSNGQTLLTPTNTPFISIALNHLEESNLHPHNHTIHSSRYPTHSSFIQPTVNLTKTFGFNTLRLDARIRSCRLLTQPRTLFPLHRIQPQRRYPALHTRLITAQIKGLRYALHGTNPRARNPRLERQPHLPRPQRTCIPRMVQFSRAEYLFRA